MKMTRVGAIAALLASAGLAWGAGNWSTLPVVGGASFCGSTVTGTGNLGGVTGQGQGTLGSICGQTIPAGPPGLTGVETVPMDTNLGGGAPPQTVVMPTALLGPLNTHWNRLIGGDFATNLWQRGTTPLTAGGATVATMTADRWWVIAQGNNLTVSKQTPAASAANYVGNGFYSTLRFARPSGTPTGASCVGQVLDKESAGPLIGNNAIFSFYGYAPTTYSATNSNVTVTIAYFTAADAAATQASIGNAGGNSSTFALSVSGQASGITGYTAVTAGSSPNFPASTVASGVATVPLTTTPTRYSFWAPIPTANASGTAVTGVGVAICGTFVATTTVATDYFEIEAAQVQAMPATSTNNLPNGVISPSGFERRQPEVEQGLQQYYSYVLIESASAVGSRTVCHFTTANTAMQCPVTYPVPMRIAPVAKYTAGFQGFTTTAETAASACTALATDATVTFIPSVNQTMVQCTLAGTTAAVGLSMTLWDLGTGSATGVMQFSAEP